MTIATDDYVALSEKVKAGLRRAFPHDTVETRPGYKGRIHVLVVSSMFNGKTERQKQEMIREILNEELPDAADAVSVTIVYGTDEL